MNKMLPKFHFIFGIVFVIFLYFSASPLIPLYGLAIILFSSILIDADHYLYYIFKKKDWNIFRTYNWYKKNVKILHSLNKEQRKTIYFGFYIFHGIEILLILFFLGIYISPIFSFILVGFVFHLFLDFISEIIFEQRFDKISVFYNILTFRKLIHIDEFEQLNKI